MIGPIAYISGKNRLASKIISYLPDHFTYVEPFAGGAQVLFHKMPSNVEVLNDLDFDIVNFFRVCQWHYEELIRYLRYCLISRKWHDLLSVTKPETLTDIQRAGRFFYLQKNSFGGLVLNRNYHYGVTNPPNYNASVSPRSSRPRTSGFKTCRSNPYPTSRFSRNTTDPLPSSIWILRTTNGSCTISTFRIGISKR